MKTLRHPSIHTSITLLPLLAVTVVACAPGTLEEDAGPADTDAGVSTDAGSPEVDAGVPDPCEGASYDAVLGPLTVGSGFAIVGSGVSVADSLLAFASLTDGSAERVYAVDTSTQSVVDLGTWPALGAGTSVFDLVPADETPDMIFPSAFLAAADGWLAAGYTEPFDAELLVAPGKVARHDIAAQTTEYASAPNNYSAVVEAGGNVSVNSTAIKDVSGGPGLYVWGGPAVPTAASGVAVADWGSLTDVFNGYTAIVDNAFVVGAFYESENHLVAPTTENLTSNLLAGTQLDLSTSPEVFAGAVSGVTSMGTSLAVIVGDYFTPLEGVLRVDLAGGADAYVLDAVDACTSVNAIASIGDDLLVAVTDVNGTRLLRVAEGS
jgi:hypothetical protein